MTAGSQRVHGTGNRFAGEASVRLAGAVGRMGRMSSHPDPRPAADQDPQRFVVVTQEGMGVSESEREDDGANPADLVEQPAKVMRIGSMIKQLLEEVRNAPLDQAGRTRLAEIHRRSIAELKQGLAPELVEELDRIALPFHDEAPSDAELRIAQAQLVGWLEGLFHGIQTALFAQQMAAQAQLQQMRALPAGHPAHPDSAGRHAAPGMHPGQPAPAHEGGPTGQYL
jgi:Bacterial proteasome activator